MLLPRKMQLSREWVEHQTPLLEAAYVEDFSVVGLLRGQPPERAGFVAFYCRGESFQDMRVYTREMETPLGPMSRPAERLEARLETSANGGVTREYELRDAHSRLYKSVHKDGMLVTAVWPGLPKVGLWSFRDVVPGLVLKQLVLAPKEGTGYSVVAGNPTVFGNLVLFEGRAETVDWRIYQATWDGKSMAVVDDTPLCDGANPSLLYVEEERRLYCYFSRRAPGDVRFTTHVMYRDVEPEELSHED